MKAAFLLLLMMWGALTAAQTDGDLFDELGAWNDDEKLPLKTFRTTRIVNMQSVENPHKGELVFTIGHRFGNVRSGFYEMFGLDLATIRLGLDYGINSWLGAGIGRSTFEKTWDIYLKAGVVTQEGAMGLPVSISWYAGASQATLRLLYPEENDNFSGRLSMVNSLMVSRKFSECLSMQVSPIWLRSSYLTEKGSAGNLVSIGLATRVRLAPIVHLNIEYIPLLVADGVDATNPLSAGFDIETGGHVFQLFFSNTQGIFDKAYLVNTRGSWDKGDIFFGFTITRVFYL
jgi:hypothetical protein